MPVASDSSLTVVQLKDAVVVASVAPVKVVADTVEYNPASYRLAEDAMLEDILRRIPGIEINGDEITLHGKVVKQLLIDGQRFFAGDIKTGLQNLSADMIARVRAYERESDFSRITGIDDGEKEAVLDLKVKPHLIGKWTANVAGGYGLHNRYNARVNVNQIDKKRQINIVSNFNNVNGSININNASRSQLGGGSSGDAHKRNVGFSMSSKDKKLNYDFTLNYSGNDKDLRSDKYIERLYSDGMTTARTIGQAFNINHTPSFDGRFEWTPRKNLVVLVRPKFKYAGNRNSSHSEGDNYGLKGELKSTVNDFSKLNQNNFTSSVNVNVTLRNLSGRKGRNLSFLTIPSYSFNSDKTPLVYNTLYPSKKLKTRKVFVNAVNPTLTNNFQLSYSEPLGRGYFIQAIANAQLVFKKSDRGVYDLMAAASDWQIDQPLPAGYESFLIGDVSSRGKYMLSNNKFSLNMRYTRKKINVTAGLTLSPQFSRLEYADSLGRDTVVRKSAFFVAPNLNLVLRPRENERISLVYNAFVTAPSMYNLMAVSSGTNPLYIHIGNESLLPAYTHKIEFNYNMSNASRQSSVVSTVTARIFQNQTSNCVEYNTETGGTTTIPMNINGSWDIKGSMAYNKTLPNGFSLVQHASADYTHTNSYLYDSHTRTSDINALRRLMVKESLDFQWRCSWLELVGNINADLTSETCSLRPQMNQLPYSVGAGLKAVFVCPWLTRLNVDYSYLLQRGYIFDELNRSYNVLNISISQPFFKRRFIVSVESYDLIGQLPNLTRTFSLSSRSINLFNGYNRYVMLRLVYKFRKID